MAEEPLTIRNPVLPGFHPDPSFLRVGDDYYLANSTFEWFPGVPIHHSRDLVHWRLIGHALTRASQLDLRGVSDSGGVWAPSLSHHEGLFWLVYTNVHTRVSNFKDVPVYLSTAPDILGPWSDPIFLHSAGFDPSLFHDDDGRTWLANMRWDFRKNRGRFAGIYLQEYDPKKRELVGSLKQLLRKPQLCEGPNLYKRDGWYYLMMAEGGTGWNHGISMARSRTIDGPYQLDPQPLVLTTRKDPQSPLQKAGHGELVQTAAGEWYLAHLCSRPIYPERRCPLGRETAMQKVQWSDDGWLRLEHGGTRPAINVPAPRNASPHHWPEAPPRDEFDRAVLDSRWSSLRVPIDGSWLSLDARPGWLRLRGRESQQSLFQQSFIARRLQSFRCVTETCMEFVPNDWAQSAGLICYYDTRTHFYLRVTNDEVAGRVLGIVLSDDGNYDELTATQIEVDDWQRFYLQASIDHELLQFRASSDGSRWREIGPVLDASKLSDDYGAGLHFTGAMIGLCVQDLKDARMTADFDYFEMRNEI